MPRPRRVERERRGYIEVPPGLWAWLCGEVSDMAAVDMADDGSSGLDPLDVFLIVGGGRDLQEFIARSPEIVEAAVEAYQKTHGAKAVPPWLKEII